jgi:hypothetical protein
VGLLKITSYGDDSARAGHLELHIGVVSDGHELGVAWLAQEGMVGARKVRYLKGEHSVWKLARPSNVTGRST